MRYGHNWCLIAALITGVCLAYVSTHAAETEKKNGVILVAMPDDSIKLGNYHKQLCKEFYEAVKLAVAEHPVPNYDITVKKLYYRKTKKSDTEDNKTLLKEPLPYTCCNDFEFRLDGYLSTFRPGAKSLASTILENSPNKNEHLLAIIGHPFSSEAERFGTCYNQQRILFITPMATDPEVTAMYPETGPSGDFDVASEDDAIEPLTKPYVFSMNYDSDLEARYIAYYLADLEPKLHRSNNDNDAESCNNADRKTYDMALVYDFTQLGVTKKKTLCKEVTDDKHKAASKEDAEYKWYPYASEFKNDIEPIIQSDDMLKDVCIVVDGDASFGPAGVWTECVLERRYIPLRVVNDKSLAPREKKFAGSSRVRAKRLVVYDDEDPFYKVEYDSIAASDTSKPDSWVKLSELLKEKDPQTALEKAWSKQKFITPPSFGVWDNKWRLIIHADPRKWPDIITKAFSLPCRNIIEVATPHYLHRKTTEAEKKIAVIYTNTPYGTRLKNKVCKYLKDLEMSVDQPMCYQPDKENASDKEKINYYGDEYCGAITRERLKNSRYVVVAAYGGEVRKIIKDIRNATDNGVTIVAPSTLATRRFEVECERTEEYQRDMVFCTPFSYELGTNETCSFTKTLEKRINGLPSIWAAFAYDAAWIILQAAEESYFANHQYRRVPDQRPEPGEIRDYLARFQMKKTGNDGGLRVCNTTSNKAPQEGGNGSAPNNGEKQAAEEKQDKENRILFGISGPIMFNEHGHVLRRCVFIKPKSNGFSPENIGMLRPEVLHSVNMKELINSNADDKSDAIPIYTMGAKLHRLHNVDLARQTFDAEFYIWFENIPEDLLPENESAIACCIRNCLKDKGNSSSSCSLDEVIAFPGRVTGAEPGDDEPRFEIRKESKFSVNGITTYFVRGRFHAKYDLSHFPFDKQKLELRYNLLKRSLNNILLWPTLDIQRGDNIDRIPGTWKQGPVDVKHQGYLHIVRSPVESKKNMGAGLSGVTGGSGNKQNITWPSTVSTFTIERNPAPYYVTLFVPLGILTIIGVSSLGVSLRRFEVRITLAITALLSMIVHHLSQLQPIRATGAVTQADLLFLLAYCGMLFIIGTIIVFQRMYQNEKDKVIADYADRLECQDVKDPELERRAEETAENQFNTQAKHFLYAIICLLVFGSLYLSFEGGNLIQDFRGWQ